MHLCMYLQLKFTLPILYWTLKCLLQNRRKETAMENSSCGMKSLDNYVIK